MIQVASNFVDINDELKSDKYKDLDFTNEDVINRVAQELQEETFVDMMESINRFKVIVGKSNLEVNII